jgi:hypothetical protein
MIGASSCRSPDGAGTQASEASTFSLIAAPRPGPHDVFKPLVSDIREISPVQSEASGILYRMRYGAGEPWGVGGLGDANRDATDCLSVMGWDEVGAATKSVDGDGMEMDARSGAWSGSRARRGRGNVANGPDARSVDLAERDIARSLHAHNTKLQPARIRICTPLSTHPALLSAQCHDAHRFSFAVRPPNARVYVPRATLRSTDNPLI